jgi:hypothetical protein
VAKANPSSNRKLLPHIDTYRDRHGKRRYYFRKSRTAKRLALPGEPGTPEFHAAYIAALGQPEPRGGKDAKTGTLDALRTLYYESAEFKNLAATTRRETRYTLDALCLQPATTPGHTCGEVLVTTLQPKHIYAWRDKLAEKPGAANKMLRALKALLSFAKQRQFRDDNPAFGIKVLKVGSIRAWSDAELIAFEARWALGTLERTGYALALYTAQRRADLVEMRPTDGASIIVRQQKTGTDLELHIHPELAIALAAWSVCGDTILYGERGRKLNPVYFGHLMAEAIEAAGLPAACVLHGLRKTAARIIAETGGRSSAMTGHLSPQMERFYERGAEQKAMSKSAVQGWVKGRP